MRPVFWINLLWQPVRCRYLHQQPHH